MTIAFFDIKNYDIEFLENANKAFNFKLLFFKETLNKQNVVLAEGCDAVSISANNTLDEETLKILKKLNINCIALRCAGFNNVDIAKAKENKIHVVNVPAYSPHAVAEHAVALMLLLSRKLHHTYNRVKENNFSLEGLLGFEIYEKTVGIVGTGKIGSALSSILNGFGCKILAYDLHPNEKLNVTYTDFKSLLQKSDIISLHCNLTPETKHMINQESIALMQDGVMLINTSRGALLDTSAVICALKSGKIGNLGVDVYEEEENIFYQNLSFEIIKDDTFARLLTFPNVVVTPHQAFFTKTALTSIAETTLKNISDVKNNRPCKNDLSN